MGKYKAYTSTLIPFKYLKELVKENPNDAELGKKIRTLILNSKS
jgi:hypothetical protein